jgi:hypothetical protein
VLVSRGLAFGDAASTKGFGGIVMKTKQQQIKGGTFRLLLAMMAYAIMSCSGSGGQEQSEVMGEATFDPRPAESDLDSIASQLKRYRGQTKFLNPKSYHYGLRERAMRGVADAQSKSSHTRDIQESDIFKIGPDGSKALFLLNNYRGLQIISFQDGTDQGRLLSRVEATGNYPQDLYFDEMNQRLIVLENLYYDENGDYYSYTDVQSRVLTYDVADLENPRLIGQMSFKGTLRDSRMVGDVLYVATSVRPSYRDTFAETQAEGLVTSVRFSPEGVQLVDQAILSLPISYGENMNIVEVKEGQDYKYYLLAILAKGHSFWSSQSQVEVIDITDASGQIRKVMQVASIGVVRERSQTHIKDNTLIVTSNYRPQGSLTDRVAVETFLFPSPESEVIDDTEAAFRKSYQDRELAKLKRELADAGLPTAVIEDRLAAKKQQLLTDPELGLKGRFIRGGDTLLKSHGDSQITIGDTTGLAARLQDVRYHGEKLYVFWVPQNNIDPLDVFDISSPRAGITHLNHLEFDGWIQRAIPVTHGGHEYIIGLGHIIPSINNENNRRYPQVALFEIKELAQGTVQANLLSQMTLSASHSWVNFNGSDKETEVRFEGDGGTIMFKFSSWTSESYIQGGKLIGFNLENAETHRDQVFSEGGILKGEGGWLRRIFTNPELSRVQSFSDRALATFGEAELGQADTVLEAVHVLELARNIIAYETIAKGNRLRGVQIISDYSWSYQTSSETELRLVKKSMADQELSGVLGTLKLTGSYVDHQIIGSDLFVLTQQYLRTDDGQGNRSYEERYFVHKAGLKGRGLNKIELLASQSFGSEASSKSPLLGYVNKLLVLSGDRLLAAAGRSLVELARDLSEVRPIQESSCGADGADYGTLHVFSGELYLAYRVEVEDPQRDISYHRNLLVAASVGDGSLACAHPLNIPGEVRNVADSSHIVSLDNRLIDMKSHETERGVYYQPVTEKALSSLTIDSPEGAAVPLASLVDMYDPKDVDVSAMHFISGGSVIIFLESSAQDYYHYPWDVMPMRSSIMDRRWAPVGDQNYRFARLGFDEERRFTKTAFALGLPMSGSVKVAKVIESIDGKTMAVLQEGRKIRVLDVTGAPKTLALSPVLADGSLGEKVESIALKGYFYWYDKNPIHYTAGQGSLEIPLGNFGVAQVFVTDSL